MRTRMVTIERLEAVARNALMGGYGHVQTYRDCGMLRRRVRLAISMDCEAPVYAELYSRLPAKHGVKRPPMGVIIEGRCRKCRPCRERKRMFWAARAQEEWRRSPLTLFGTLTFRPEVDAMLDARARLWRDPECTIPRADDFDAYSDEDKFRTRVQFAGAEVTKWLKRLRNSDRNRRLGFRYLLVAEAHSSARTSALKHGRPHFHCLIHQAEGARIVEAHEWARSPLGAVRADRYGNPLVSDEAFLKSQWESGFSTFAMCRTPQAASYVCKYLTKEETSVRIRASFQYGATAKPESSDDRSEVKSTSPKGEEPTEGGGANGDIFYS